MKKCVLFDLDGVVINSEPLYEKATLNLMKEHNVNIPEPDWKSLHGLSEKDFYRKCVDNYNINCSVDALIRQGNRFVLDVFNNSYIPFNDGFISLFNEINSVYNLALVTATSEKIFNVINQRLKLSTYFSTIVFGGMTKKNKPYPDPYLYAIKKMNQFPANCVVIEDSLPGLKAANSAHCKIIALESTVGQQNLPGFVDIQVSCLSKITKKTIDRLLNS